ncbi:MAG: aldehyde ferredoxin oxidoreductase family protein [Candidatus Helarchaeota archaeon]|nr:aldehyde ferredoxin oxidoreductase family protein [Candidatus Helarchaeota archaeon]
MSKSDGYTGKILRVNLSEESIKQEQLSEDLKSYIGGLGIGTKIIYDSTPRNCDALGPDNILVFMTGPLTGNTVMSGRHEVISKSPATGIMGFASCGGFWGTELKRAGFDGIVISGIAKKPTLLKIENENAELLDASEYWGKGIYHLKKNIDKRFVAIGSAGENLVKVASIIDNDERSAGRSGMGAVMGSKKLKIITVKGDKKPELNDPEKVKELTKKTTDRSKDFINKMLIDNYKKFGTGAMFGVAHLMMNIGIKNWSSRWWANHVKISAQEMRKKYFEKQYYCHRCIIGCGRTIRKGDELVHGPEYETMCALGTMLLNSSLEDLIELNWLCNDYGMDTISAGGLIAFAMECFEKGLLDEELKWGDSKKAIALLKQIAQKQGLGATLASGIRESAEKIGGNAKDFAMNVKGLELPQHDPRLGMDLAYATSSRGADHLQGQPHFTRFMPIKEFGQEITASKAHIIKISQDWNVIVDSLVLCKFGVAPQGFMTVTDIVDILNAITGGDFSAIEIRMLGEKIFTIQRLYGVREAKISRKDDTIQPLFLEKNKNFNEELEAYYRRRNWDINGIPTDRLLSKLELDKPEWL